LAVDLVRQALSLADAGRPQEAIAQLRRLVTKDARNAEAASQLSWLLTNSGEPLQGEYYARRAIERVPGEVRYRRMLAVALMAKGSYAEAEAAAREAVTTDTSSWQARLDLGNALLALKRPAEAEEAFRQSGELAPGQVSPVVNRATVLNDLGRPGEALTILQRIRELHRGDIRVQSALCSKLAYLDSVSSEESLREHRRFGELVGAGGPATKLEWKPGVRPLRVGYVSPDLRVHSVSFFFEPLLEHHDRSRFQFFCYDTHGVPDATTERLKKFAHAWRIAASPQPQVLENLVRGDRIDVLIDLAGHTNGHRLHVMARRLAPVQATFLGYPNTTGVPAIDWRIVDEITDPPGTEELASEKLARVDECMLCYRPSAEAPDVTVSPCTQGALFTFGSFNMAAKVSDTCIRAWAACMKGVPGSRMLIKNAAYTIPSVQADLVARFAEHGIRADRLEFVGHTPGMSEHLAQYARVDVALDTFPYGGTTTTCDALWMGVPLLTMTGRTHASRVGASLLSCVGLNELVCSDAESMAKAAMSLARDRDQLETLRSGMRERMRVSALMDGPGYARRFERVLERIASD